MRRPLASTVIRPARTRRRTAQAFVVAVVTGIALLGPAACGSPGDRSVPSAAPTTPAPSVAPLHPSPSLTAPEPTTSSPPGPSPEPTPAPAPPAAPEPPAVPEPAPAPAPPPAPPAAPTTVPEELLGTDWETIATEDHVVALTFDGGASDAGLASILATLDAEQVPATFFVTGDFARRYPASVARIAAAGHLVANHSDTHEHYPDLTDAEIAVDLAAAHEAIAAAGVVPARPWFRFPYGDRTAADIRAVNAAGYVPVRWTVDTLGWKGTSGGVTAATVVERVLGALRPGEIVLMHCGANPDDGTTLDADALPAVIDGLQAAGYAFVTVDRMLG